MTVRADRMAQVVKLDQPDLVVSTDPAEGPDKFRGSTGRLVLVVKTSSVLDQALPGGSTGQGLRVD
jgi:hypothetical protein